MSPGFRISLPFFIIFFCAICLLATGLLLGVPKTKGALGTLRLLCVIAATLWLVCLVVLLAIQSWAGGSPELGKINGSHYYLGAHGRFTEVSRGLYNGLVQAWRYERMAGLVLILLSPIILGPALWKRLRS
jgi:hypothetical protein